MSQDPADFFKVLELVSSITSRARRAMEAKLRGRGLTYAQYGALSALGMRDGLSQAELAQALETDSTTAMVLRGSLEKKKLIERNSDPGDGRIKRISLTIAGESLLKETRPEVTELFANAGELFSETEFKRLFSLLERLREYADAAIPKPPAVEGEPKRRGRPRKEKTAEDAATEPKRRGRPRKGMDAVAEEKSTSKKRSKKDVIPAAEPRHGKAKTGRAKSVASTATVAPTDDPSTKKRGRRNTAS